jgi:hypothetical protein
VHIKHQNKQRYQVGLINPIIKDTRNHEPITPSYIKVKTAPALLAGSESASEPSTSADTGVSVLDDECNLPTNTSLSTLAVSALNTGKSSTLKLTLDRPLDSIYKTENNQVDELLTRTVFSS